MENHPSECYKSNPRRVRLAQDLLISLLNLSESNGANEVTQRILKRYKTFRQKKKSLSGTKDQWLALRQREG